MGLDKKLQEAKEWMGDRYVFHPAYRPTPKHSTNPDTWLPLRTAQHRKGKKK